MSDPSTTPEPGDAAIEVHLDAEELALVLAALRLLRSILGREEADELAMVEALLDRLGPRKAA